MPYTFTLTRVIPASAQEIYEAWLDSLAHSEMTGAEATMSDEVGAEVSAWDGYISGRNLELVAGERIVQSWRTTEFADTHGDSIVTITLEDADEGTLLTLVHSNVPDDQTSYEEGGWEERYFEPMEAYFDNLRQETADAAPKRAAPEVAAGKKARPAAPRGKASRAKKKAKRVLGAKAKAKKGAKPRAKKKAAARTASKRNSGRRKRSRR